MTQSCKLSTKLTKMNFKTQIAKEYGVLCSTLSTYLKNKNALRKANGKFAPDRKGIRTAKHSGVEATLVIWHQIPNTHTNRLVFTNYRLCVDLKTGINRSTIITKWIPIPFEFRYNQLYCIVWYIINEGVVLPVLPGRFQPPFWIGNCAHTHTHTHTKPHP